MQASQPARMLRIHIAESDRHQGKPLYEAIVAKCREMKIAGATVFRGVEGRHEQSITITIVDTPENLAALIPAVEEMIDIGTMSLSDVEVVRVQKQEPGASRREILSAFAALPGAAFMQGSPSADQLRRMLEPPAGKVPVVIDTDTYNEIDDQYAVAYGLLSPDRMEVEAIYAAPYLNDRSTSPADGMEKSYQEILRLLKFLKRDPAGLAFRGSDRFFAADKKPVESPAARDLIARALKPRPTPLYVLTLGCPVNVSSAILLEPKIKEKIVVVWLGGANHDWPSAREFNLQQDLHASRVLFDSGVPLVQIPTKNVAEHLRTTLPEAERFLKGRSRLGDYLFDQFVDYYKAHTRGKPQPYPWSKVIWDISTVAWIVNPAWIPSALVPSPVLTDDMRWQKSPGRHPIRVATNVLRDPVFFDLFEKLAKT